MQLETFRGRELQAVVSQVRRALGDDAMIVKTQVIPRGSGRIVEIVAARASEVEAFKRRIDGGHAAAVRAQSRSRIGPYVVALVGPPGAGKTTTAVKLALHPRGLAHRRVGLVTLDTYRVAAIEELQTYAEVADLPLEVIYERREVPAAIRRMREVDVILIDTPGRSPADEESGEWCACLRAFDPDEIHLLLPAGVRLETARRYRERFAATGITHALFTKLDDLNGGEELMALAEALELPARWVTDGHEIPGALSPAGPRILGSLGMDSGNVEPAAQVG
ncbi:MAG: hypothetical protein ACE5GJ_12055 [Gemmatimonadota bacterium]